MKLALNKIKFILPEKPFGSFPEKMDTLTDNVKRLGDKAGTDNRKFGTALFEVRSAIISNLDLANVLDKPIKVRALAVLFPSEMENRICLTESVFRKIDKLKPNPSSLLIQNIYQYYLSRYDQLDYPSVVAAWLKTSMKKKGLLKDFHNYILSKNGPKWIADRCLANKREFSNELKNLNLENYASGRFLTAAKNIYFVEQLNTIPVNQPHPLLTEIQNRSAFESRFDTNLLVGHKILQILIKRAPNSGIDDSWLNVIMAIAGDPRVPKTHPRYQKWWSALDHSLNLKVRGWLSRLDLRLFLEALKNYSFQPGKADLKRMFPSRKKFLEGLLDEDLITNTRLYLSAGASAYLKHEYEAKHLPNYSHVDGLKSIIHVQLGESHIIEGSHTCYLWIYPRLDPSAIVFDHAKTSVSYRSLTQGLSDRMSVKGTPHLTNITHSPANFSWQHKAITALNSIGVNVNAKDVLSKEDYFKYRRRYGVRYGY